MPQSPPRKAEPSPGGGGVSLALWLALGLLPGLGLGVIAGRALFAKPSGGYEAGEAGSGKPEYGALDRGGEETASASGKRGGSSLNAKPIQGTLYENLHATAAGMSQGQRLEELKRMLEEDTRPERQLFSFRNMQNGGVDRQLQYMALIQKEDLPLVKELLDGMSPSKLNNSYTMRSACVTAWAMLDPQGMENWVTDKLTADRQGSYYNEAQVLAGYWASLDSEVAWGKASQLDRMLGKNDENNTQWIQRIMGKLIKENAQVAYQRAQSLENRGLRRTALTSVLVDMAKNDFGKAMEMAGQQGTAIEANKLEAGVLSSYANSTSKFQEVADYIVKNGSEYVRQNSLGNMMYNWARKDSEGLKKWMDENQAAVDELDLERRWGNYFSRNEDPENLIKRAEGIEDKEARQSKLNTAYSALMEKRPEEALSRLKDMDAETARQVAPSMLSRLSNYDPERAASLIATLPEAAQADAMGNVFSTWLNQNPENASAWLDKQPTGAAKDRGIEQLVSTQARRDPETAALWALQISTEDRQRNSLTSATYTWAQKDPVAARDWVKAQNLPDKTRQQLLEHLDSVVRSRTAQSQ